VVDEEVPEEKEEKKVEKKVEESIDVKKIPKMLDMPEIKPEEPMKKVVIPSEVYAALKVKKEECEKKIKQHMNKEQDVCDWYFKLSQVVHGIEQGLKDGMDPKMVALNLHQHSTPVVQEIPPVVWKFLISGGKKVTDLKDLFKEVKIKKE